MSLKVYVNGHFVPKDQAVISVYDHGFLYGDGVFEGVRVYNGRAFRLDEHLKRLYESAKTVALDMPFPPEEMKEKVLQTIRINGLQDAYVRLVVSRGRGDLGIDPRKCPEPTIVIIAESITLYPEELYEKGLKVVTVPTRRMHSEMVNPRVKSLNYLNNILAKVEGNHLGYPEVIMLNSEGYVVEGSADNIFIVRDGAVITPAPHLGILEGITRNAVMELARSLELDMREEVFTRHDLFNADECFLTGTAAELIPVVEVDGRKIGDGKPGPVTRRLWEAFKELRETTGTPVYEGDKGRASAD